MVEYKGARNINCNLAFSGRTKTTLFRISQFSTVRKSRKIGAGCALTQIALRLKLISDTQGAMAEPVQAPMAEAVQTATNNLTQENLGNQNSQGQAVSSPEQLTQVQQPVPQSQDQQNTPSNDNTQFQAQEPQIPSQQYQDQQGPRNQDHLHDQEGQGYLEEWRQHQQMQANDSQNSAHDDSAQTFNIYVGNLNNTVEDDDLRAAFEGCGPIALVRVFKERATGAHMV